VAGLLQRAPARRSTPFDYETAVRVLAQRGLDEHAVRLGTIPQESLDFVRAIVTGRLSHERPLRALHIGNFVGISLAALTAAVLDVHDESVVFSVDPNIPHLGIADPQTHTLALLSHFGLQAANVVICGYTLDKTPGTDGLPIEGYDAAAAWDAEAAGENVLPNLERSGIAFDLALLDGSHIGAYARRELAAIGRVVRSGGLVILDDVSESWTELLELFAEAAAGDASPFEQVDYDGRVGVLRVR
jgi:hypothetical protein